MFFAASKILAWLIYPLSLGLLSLILAYGAFLLGKKRSFHVLFLLGIVVLYLCSIGPGAAFLLRTLERKHLPPNPSGLKADAIVVLGGDLRKKVFPREDIEVDGNRVIKGVRLFKQGAAPLMIMSGGSGDLFDQAFKEVVIMKELATQFEVPKEKIIIETESRNTRENILYTKKILDRVKAKRIILVTSAYHLPRAYALAKKAGIDAVPVPSDFYAADEGYDAFSFLPHPTALLHSTMALKEHVGIFVYWLMGWI